MNRNALPYMEVFYMALADKTRLRILNLMNGAEACVHFFTEVLGESQPKISRHLAYLRKAGIVQARREGKWMHYTILEPELEGVRRVLDEALRWLASQPVMRAEREKYKTMYPSSIETIEPSPQGKVISGLPYAEFRLEGESDARNEPEYEYARPAHNDLEEFLL